jgi:AcrR family transcriptional regulator
MLNGSVQKLQEIPEKDSRNLLLTVALQLFLRQGYEGTSIDDIRREAGFKSKASLYTHFKSKEEVATALIQKWLGQQETYLLQAYQQAQLDPLSQFIAATRASIEWGFQHRAEYTFCNLRVQQEKLVRGQYDYLSGQRESPAYSRMLDLLARLRENYPVRSIANTALLSMVVGLISKAIIDNEAFGNIPLEQKIEQTFQMCLGVLFSEPVIV